MTQLRCSVFALIGALVFAASFGFGAQNPGILAEEQKTLTEEQMRDFLLHAKIVKVKPIGKGITRPWRVTLKDGAMEHDASFQYVEDWRPSIQLQSGRTEQNFKDSYKFSIAAYELSRLLGISDMMPVTVERKVEGKLGALSWWLPVKMDEAERRSKKLQPPDPLAWDNQKQRMWVFSQLVYDTDRTQQNILISEDWHIWMIDFSRAFRYYTTLENPKILVRCDRKLLQKLRQLDKTELEQKTKDLLNDMEIKGIMARKDKIIEHFEKLGASKGEEAVFYD